MSKYSKINLFDEETLAANRDGYMTKAQRKDVDSIRQEIRFVRYMALGIAIFFLIVFAQNILHFIFCGSFISLITASFFLSSAWDNRNANRDLYKGLVDEVEGEISFRKGRWRQHFLLIDDQKFAISKSQYKVLHQQLHEVYRIYYALYSNKLLSLEAIEPILSSDTSPLEDEIEISQDYPSESMNLESQQ